MKKFFSMMLIAAAALSFAACEPENSQDKPSTGTKLEAPAPTAEAGETYIVVSWEAISGADSYTLNLKGKNYTTSETTYTFENLNKGDYTIRVKATGEGYKDSDFGTVTVTVTGATSVDWFTQTAQASTEGVAIEFFWKGENVKSIYYGLFLSENVASADDNLIIANLSSLGTDAAAVLEAVNGEGFEGVFNQNLLGSSNYTLFAHVVNADGIEFLARTEVVTPEAVVAPETEAWLGYWTAETNEVVEYDLEKNDGSWKVSTEKNEFSLLVEVEPGTTNNVFVYGISFMGVDFPAFGTVKYDAENNLNLLYIWSYQFIADMGEGNYAGWLTICNINNTQYGIVTGEFPTYILVQDAAGNVTCQMYEGELSNGGTFTSMGTELFQINPETGGLGFLALDEAGTPNSRIKSGAMQNIQKSSGPSSVAYKANKFAGAGAFSTSVYAF